MINLEHLTEQERKIIMDVLQRDEQLRQAEQERVKKLKTELHELRRKSAVKVDEDSGDSGKKVCARCREPLGTIFNSGEVCPRCQHKVCSSCKVNLPNTKKWLCTICNKNLQIRLESGEAFGPRREGQAEAYGTDLVKMSLAKNKTGHEPIVQVNGGPQSPADSGFHGRAANVPSVGESNSTTFDEDYPSDVSYEQSVGTESIGPSVSQRGTIVSNGVEGGVHGSADITMERVPSRNASPASSRRGRQGGEAGDYSQYEKSRSRQSHSPAGSRRNLHGSELSEDERSYRSNGSGGRGMSGHPSIPTIAIQDAGDSSFSEGEYYSGSERLHRQALEANMYREPGKNGDLGVTEFDIRGHGPPKVESELGTKSPGEEDDTEKTENVQEEEPPTRKVEPKHTAEEVSIGEAVMVHPSEPQVLVMEGPVESLILPKLLHQHNEVHAIDVDPEQKTYAGQDNADEESKSMGFPDGECTIPGAIKAQEMPVEEALESSSEMVPLLALMPNEMMLPEDPIIEIRRMAEDTMTSISESEKFLCEEEPSLPGLEQSERLECSRVVADECCALLPAPPEESLQMNGEKSETFQDLGEEQRSILVEDAANPGDDSTLSANGDNRLGESKGEDEVRQMESSDTYLNAPLGTSSSSLVHGEVKEVKEDTSIRQEKDQKHEERSDGLHYKRVSQKKKTVAHFVKKVMGRKQVGEDSVRPPLVKPRDQDEILSKGIHEEQIKSPATLNQMDEKDFHQSGDAKMLSLDEESSTQSGIAPITKAPLSNQGILLESLLSLKVDEMVLPPDSLQEVRKVAETTLDSIQESERRFSEKATSLPEQTPVRIAYHYQAEEFQDEPQGEYAKQDQVEPMIKKWKILPGHEVQLHSAQHLPVVREMTEFESSSGGGVVECSEEPCLVREPSRSLEEEEFDSGREKRGIITLRHVGLVGSPRKGGLLKDPNTGQWVTYRNGQLVTSSDAVNADQDPAKGTSKSNGHAGRAPSKEELRTVPDVQVDPPLDKPAAPTIEVDIEREPPQRPRVPEGDERTTVSSLNEEFKSVGKTDSLSKFTSRSSTSSVTSPVEKRLSKKNMLHKGSSSSLTSLYSTGEEFYGKYPITGDVSFGLGYNFKTNVFEVKIGGCRDLVPIDAKKNKSDPYIKTYLLPDKSKNSKRKTRTKKGTINPNYSENLKYPIAQSELETRTLSVAIWHYDRFGHNMFLGEVLLPLDGLDLTSYPVKWHQLKTRVPPNETKPISYKGDIVLALMFETLLDENKNGTSGSKSSLRRKKKGPSSKQIGGTLKIHIKEAKNLTPPRVGAVVNPYVKVYLEPDRSKTGKKKTSAMRNTLNPSYEQSLEFPNVTEDILKERALEVGIWDSEIGSSSLLGGVRLGSGTGKSYGRGVEWQDSTGIEIQLWEEMLRNHNQWVEACLTLRGSFDKDKKT